MLNNNPPPDVVEVDGNSTFHCELPTYTHFLRFRQALSAGDPVKRSLSYASENILCKFSPNPRINETIIVIVATQGYIYIATKLCNLYKASAETFEVEDHMSLILTQVGNLRIYRVILLRKVIIYVNRLLCRTITGRSTTF